MTSQTADSILKILIVDHESRASGDLEDQVKELGYLVCGRAATGDQAMDLMVEQSPDLVLVNFSLQGEMDGTTTAEVIRDQWETPMVLLLAKDDPGRLDRTRLTCPACYLTKPFETADLKRSIETALHAGDVNRERRDVERALRASEERHKTILRTALDGFFLIDLEGHFLESNEALCRMTGYSEQELLTMTFSDLKVLERVETDDWIRMVARQGEDRFESRLCRKDGNTLDIAVSVKFLPLHGGCLVVFLHDISARIQAVEDLRKSREIYRLAVNGSRDGIWDWDLLDNSLFLSPRWKELIGYRDEELPNAFETFESHLHPEDKPRVLAFVDQYLQGLIPVYSIEFRFRHKDGSYRWILARGEALRDAQGVPYRMAGSHADVTDRKLAEDRLRKSEEKYRLMADNTLDVIWTMNLDLEFTYVNPACFLLTGFTPEEWIGSRLPEHCDEENFAKMAEIILHEMVKGPESTGVVFEAVMLKKDLQPIPVEIHGKVICNRQGEPVALQGVTRDITERRRAEETLRESEERFRLTFQTSPDAININRLEDGLYVDINDGFTQLTGFRREDVLGRTSLEISIWHDPEDRKRLIHGLLDRGFYENLEARFRRKDGSLTTALMSARIIPLQGVPHIISITRDISDRKRADEEKEKLQEQLQHAQKMEAIGTLAGGVAHDFNNLLQAINGYTQLLLLDKKNHEPDYSHLKAIQNAGNRAAELVRQLLLFSRKAETERQAVELDQVVEDARRILERTIPKMVEIQVHVASPLWAVNADLVQMEQILLNLAANAADAMPEGGVLVIEIENVALDQGTFQDHLDAPPGRYVLLSVSDTGQGMEPEIVAKIFEPFFTTKGVGKGTGLGLASVYGIVKSHGGYISCLSEVGRGTRFKILLPAIEKTAGIEFKAPEFKPLQGRGETILIVDDELSIRDFASQALRKFGYAVLTAASGEEALDLFFDPPGEIDLVILDIGMPGMGGLKCLGEIRRRAPSARVLIASGYSIQGQVQKTLEAGAAGYVAKPYQLTDLLDKVRAVFDRG